MKEETYRDDGIECPYCGYLHEEESWFESIYDQNLTEFTCDNCKKTMKVEASMSWTWTAEPII